jgi:hypothetical protein
MASGSRDLLQQIMPYLHSPSNKISRLLGKHKNKDCLYPDEENNQDKQI